MCNWRPIALAIGILASVALPASAGHGGGPAQGGHVHTGRHFHGTRPFIRGNALPSFETTNSLAALELSEPNQTFVSRRFGRGLRTRGVGDLGFLDGGWGGWYGTDGVSAIQPAPEVVVLHSPPRPAAEQRLTVETTASGVQIVRGPGSRHVMP